MLGESLKVVRCYADKACEAVNPELVTIMAQVNVATRLIDGTVLHSHSLTFPDR